MLEITIMPMACQDMAEICEHLSSFYPSTALKQYDRIMEKIMGLASFPEKYEEYGKGSYQFHYRRMVVDRYLVFYVVTGTTVEIRRILPGNRDIPSQLKI